MWIDNVIKLHCLLVECFVFAFIYEKALYHMSDDIEFFMVTHQYSSRMCRRET